MELKTLIVGKNWESWKRRYIYIYIYVQVFYFNLKRNVKRMMEKFCICEYWKDLGFYARPKERKLLYPNWRYVNDNYLEIRLNVEDIISIN